MGGLKDAYGTCITSPLAYEGNPQNKTQSAYVRHDYGMTALVASFTNGSKIGIEYIVGESKLKFYRDDDTAPKYTMKLPTDIVGITHWYPYVSLQNANDVCQIGSVRIE